ncbi:MAG TPA: bifunctional UDP-3-O-[3-hydroxymyristoyl] N-acetylglucosamine deacetylase/3-hydroxyacyl-ACP dehydratase [Bacteroidales bacterium]
MSDKQQTILKQVTVKGSGLHTGQVGSLTFHPAPENHGIKFRRVDLENQPVINADVDHVVSTDRGTTIGVNGAKVYTIEHVLAALTGLGIDNVMIDLDIEEIPIQDGSSKYFVQALQEAGIVEQNAPKNFLIITEPIQFEIPEKKIKILIEPAEEFSLSVVINFETAVLGEQTAKMKHISEFVTEIAPCRTFVFLHELEFLLNNNLIKGGDLSNAIVFVNRKVNQDELDRLAELFNKPKVKVKEEGILNNLDLYFDNEPARHKLLDVIGDLTLLGRPIKGHVTAIRPGHLTNTEFAKIIKQKMNIGQEKKTSMQLKPPFNIYAEPKYDVNQIKKILPHRSPFLLVDKVLDVNDTHIVAVKNVTMNEPFFTGHFPDEPLMPGVLLVEAMAQAGGIFVLNQVTNPEEYSTYFLKINDVRFRSKVVPGDVVVFVIELTAPIKRGICSMKGIAYVGDNIVTEGQLTAQVVRNKEKSA